MQFLCEDGSKYVNLQKPNENLSYRLPSNSIPLSYEVIIKSNIDENDFEFCGKVNIHVKIVESTDQITLHYRMIEIERINLYHTDGTDLAFNELPFDQVQSHDFLKIYLPEAYQPSKEFILEITYKGELENDPSGFFRASYNDENGNSVWYAATNFQIDNARHAMPCYDEPGIRAPIRLTLIHGSNYSAISNMEVDEKIEFIDFCVTKFKQTPPMQTYLLAFVISDFKYVCAKNTRIPQRIYARPSSILNGEANFAAEIVGPILEAIEQHFGMEYPLSKLDHGALTHFMCGAMENFGLVLYLERALLLDTMTAKENEESRKMTVIRIVTHEMIHQFFGNTVSPKWWNFTWLSEGLATLYEVYIANLVFPEYNFMNRFVTVNMPLSFKEDVAGSWPMNHYTEKPSELKNYFSRIGYEKSGCVLRMFQEAITPKTFAKGLKFYFNNSFMKSVTPNELHGGLQKAFNQDFPSKSLNIPRSLSSWENQAGYPIVSVRIYGNDLILSQHRYPKSGGEVYSIPLTIATKSNPDFNLKQPKFWLNAASMSVANSSIDFNVNDWIILNIQQVGYYRVDYDTKLWRLIIKQLIENSNLIHSINRAVLQDEIYYAWSDLGRVTAYDCLDILSYFGRENEPIAWSKAQTLMGKFYDRLFGTCVHKKFLEFFQTITNPHVEKHGFESIAGESSSIKSLRMSAKSWNCRVLGMNCLKHELFKLKRYLSTRKTSSIDFCAALRNLDEETYSSLATLVAMNSKFENRENFLNNLGCSLNRNNLLKFLEISINSKNVLTEVERQNVIKMTMGRSLVAFEATVDFVYRNCDLICKRISSSSIHNILSSMTAFINTQLHADKFELIMNKFQENGAINDENVTTFRKSYLENIKWHIDNYEGIENWMFSKLQFSMYERIKYQKCKDLQKCIRFKSVTKKRKFVEIEELL